MKYVIQELVKKHNGKKILIMLDNAGVHDIEALRKINKNFYFYTFPKRTTAVLQPADCGFLQNFKRNYNHLLVEKILGGIKEIPSAQNMVNIGAKLKAIKFEDFVEMINKATIMQRKGKRY